MHSVIPNKSADGIRTMLPSTASNITCHTDIKRTIALAGEDVDARTLLTHSAAPWSSQGQALGPRFRGCQEILRTDKFVAPAKAGAQGQATEIAGFPLSRERREPGASLGCIELDYPRFRGDDENFVVPSERGYRSEMGTTYANF